jgi:hypothetical protein
METIRRESVSSGSIPDLHGIIGSARSDPLSIGGPCQGMDSIRMTMVDENMASIQRIPDLY